MTTAQLFSILILAAMWVLGTTIMVVVIFLVYRRRENGVRPIDESINKSSRTIPFSTQERIFYYGLIALSLAYAVWSIDSGRSPILPSAIVTSTVMIWLNAKKRTGRPILMLVLGLAVFLFGTITYLIVGLPAQHPLLKIGQTEIKMARTKVTDLQKDHFKVTLLKTVDSDKQTLFQSPVHSLDESPMTTHGLKIFDNHEGTIATYECLLEKGGQNVGSLLVLGNDNGQEKSLGECTIVGIILNSDAMPQLLHQCGSISIDSHRVDTTLTTNSLKTILAGARDLYSESYLYNGGQTYHATYSSISDHLFWNQYKLTVSIDHAGRLVELEYYSIKPH